MGGHETEGDLYPWRRWALLACELGESQNGPGRFMVHEVSCFLQKIWNQAG